MVKLLDNNGTDTLAKDIIKVDKILVNCGNDILRTFTEPKKLPRFIKNRTNYIYLPLVMHALLYWRVKAWKDYLSLKSGGVPSDHPYIKGKTTAARLVWLCKLLG